jgi:hypothetical protein
MLRDFFARFRKRADDEAIEQEIEREGMTPAERRLTGESIEDLQADNLSELESQTGTSVRHFDDDEEKPRP